MNARSSRATLLVLLLLSGVLFGCGAGDRVRTLNVFAAASLTDVTLALADSFAHHHPKHRVVLSTAATSVLARQIESGAPADVMLSANPGWVERLDSLQLLDGVVDLPVTNELALYRRIGASPGGRVAIGDPDHVPIGTYARSFLECTGEWTEVYGRIVPTSDARAALRMLRTEAVPAAVLYVSDASALEDGFRITRFEGGCAPVVRYVGAAIINSQMPEAAAAFLNFVASEAQHGTWRAFGFTMRADSTVRSDA